MNWKWLLSIPGALVGITVLWATFGFPVPATSGDVQRLERKDLQFELRQRKLERNFLLVLPAPADGARKAILENQLIDLQEEIKDLQKREKDAR